MAKGPKTMNPADRARKEARKKELKKNKKQRQLVRTAVIESRDPEHIIAELEKLDKLEFDTSSNSIPNVSDTFLKDKRKRLKETLNKIATFYQKEDPEKYESVKNLEKKYEINYQKMSQEFHAIKAAQEVKIEDIFLPPEPDPAIFEIADDDPLLSENLYITPFTEGLKPPGCPPGKPPDLAAIVKSLKMSLATPAQALPTTFPPELMKFQLSNRNMSGTGKNMQIKFKSRYVVNNKQATGPPATKSTTSKAAVIESKPVLFKPKVTKFVPSSVRTKLNKT